MAEKSFILWKSKNILVIINKTTKKYRIMKKIITGLAILSTLVACQDELYDNDLKEHKTNQAVYIDGGTSLTVNLAENTDT